MLLQYNLFPAVSLCCHSLGMASNRNFTPEDKYIYYRTSQKNVCVCVCIYMYVCIMGDCDSRRNLAKFSKTSHLCGMPCQMVEWTTVSSPFHKASGGKKGSFLSYWEPH